VNELKEACKDADHLMCTPLSLYMTYFLAKEFSKPISVGCVSPAGPTRHFHCVVMSPAATWLPDFLRKTYNVFSHLLVGELSWMGTRPLLNSAWKEVFGHTLPLKEPLAAAFKKNPPLMLYAYSKYILEKPTDWADVQHVSGYWFLKSQVENKLPEDLETFIHTGEKPIYIGYGSMNSADYKQGELKNLILKSIELSGCRAVVLNAGLDLKKEELPKHIFATEPVPFDLLFPKMAAVVHHGGAGTTAAGLKAGVPSVITPLIYDQRFWAWCVAQKGLGSKPIFWNDLTAEKLSDAIKNVLSDEVMKQKAFETGQCIRNENGIEQAVNLFNAYYC
jgi:UDP:flavonoid glycosyltransferase YjiC (YdhE family)